MQYKKEPKAKAIVSIQSSEKRVGLDLIFVFIEEKKR